MRATVVLRSSRLLLISSPSAHIGRGKCSQQEIVSHCLSHTLHKFIIRRHATQLANTICRRSISQHSSAQNGPLAASTAITPLTFSVTAWTEKHEPKPIDIHIHSFKDLLFEADVLNEDSKGQLLIDDPDLKQQAKLWHVLVSFRDRLHGSSGVRDIWTAIEARQINLPTDGEYADKLWPTFLEAGLESQDEGEMMNGIWKYVKMLYEQFGQRYSPMYNQIIGHFLSRSKKEALAWHNRLRDIGLPTPETLQSLIRDTLQKDKLSIKNLQVIYRETGQNGMYDFIIPTLCARRMYREAVNWHSFLLDMNDCPSNPHSAQLLRMELLQNPESLDFDLDPKPFALQKQRGRRQVDGLAGVDKENLITRLNMNEMLGEIHGVAPKTPSDKFLARVFATKALSVDTVIPLLSTFGVKAIGPLSLHELAVRCHSPLDIMSKLVKLDEANISIGTSTYSNLIKKLASRNRTDLINSILSSDIHPDVYDDEKTQRSLLRQYIVTGDWIQAWRTLEVLTVFENGPGTEKVWNAVLAVFIDRKDCPKISRIVEDMLERQIPVSINNLRRCFFRLIPAPAHPGKRPNMWGDPVIENLNYVSNLWLSILRSDGVIPASFWSRIHCSYGMLGLQDELENLSIWLAFYYSTQEALHRVTKNIESSAAFHVLSHEDAHPLRQIFSPQRQASIISWGFKSLSRPQKRLEPIGIEGHSTPLDERGGAKSESWARGIALLVQLRAWGVNVSPRTVAATCRLCLRMLFDDGVSNRKINREAKLRNNRSLYDMVDHINEVWGSNIFGFSQELLEPMRTDKEKSLIWDYIVKGVPADQMPVATFWGKLMPIKAETGRRSRGRSRRSSTIRVGSS